MLGSLARWIYGDPLTPTEAAAFGGIAVVFGGVAVVVGSTLTAVVGAAVVLGGTLLVAGAAFSRFWADGIDWTTLAGAGLLLSGLGFVAFGLSRAKTTENAVFAGVGLLWASYGVWTVYGDRDGDVGGDAE